MSKADVALERKNQIINATIECISRYGYSNFSMQDVARIADVSKGIIHYYFLNKEDLMMAVLDRVAGDIEGLLSDIMEASDDPKERLCKLVRAFFSVAKEKREYYCISIDFWTQINQKENVRETIARHYAKLRTATAGIIQQGIDSGVFRPGSAAEYASLIVSMVDGISLQWLFDEAAFDYDQMTKRSEEMVLSFVIKTT